MAALRAVRPNVVKWTCVVCVPPALLCVGAPVTGALLQLVLLASTPPLMSLALAGVALVHGALLLLGYSGWAMPLHAVLALTVTAVFFTRARRGRAVGPADGPHTDAAPTVLLLTAVAVLFCAAFCRHAHIFASLAWGMVFVMAAFVQSHHAAGRPPDLRKVLGNLVAFGASALVALLLVEGGVRLIFPPGRAAPTGYRMPHPTLLFQNRPGYKGVLALANRPGIPDAPDGRRFFRVRISHQGFRGPAPGKKEPGEYRILMVGDSFTFGYGVEEHEAIPSVLEELLEAELPGRPVSVVNGGVTGYGPWQERGLLREKGFSLEPDLVILQLFTENDLHDTLLQEGRFLRSYLPYAMEWRRQCVHLNRWHYRLQMWCREHTRTYQLLAAATQEENLLADALEVFRFAELTEDRGPPPPEDRHFALESDLKQWYPELEDAWAMFQQDVRAIARDCAERDIDLAAFVVPPMHSIWDPGWAHQTKLGGGAGLYERYKTLRMMEAFLEESGVAHVPLREALEDAGHPFSLYFRLNRHLTPKGCRVVASELANYLLEKGYVEKARLTGWHRHQKHDAAGPYRPAAPL